MSIGIEKSSVEAIAIGRFDGLHKGHQALLSHLGEKGALVVIETQNGNLTPCNYRNKHTSYPTFTYNLEEIKNLSGEGFVKLLRHDFPALKKIVVGEDFCFGKDRSSNASDLQKLSSLEIVVVDEVRVGDVAVHAKTIRKLLVDGDVDGAALMLGYPYEIVGSVINGQGLGAQHFVPTLNLDVSQFLLPASGIYVTKTELNGILYSSVTFLGHRLSTDGNFCVETHLLDMQIDFSPNEVTVSFFHRLRENRLYNNFEELKGQINKDIEMARDYFKKGN
jgi:riboflavin kinase/FMN adenylyltransferase